MTQGYKLRMSSAVACTTTVTYQDVWVQNAFAIGSYLGGTSTYYSPYDLTAVYASGTTLTIGAAPAGIATRNFLKVTVTRANGTRVVYDNNNYLMTYAAPTLTVTGAAFLNTDLDYRVEVYYQAKGIGITGNASPTHINVIGGNDGGGGNLVRICDVNATNELLTRSLSDGVHDSARPTKNNYIGARAHAGNPAAVSANDDAVDTLATLLGQLRIYLDSALNTTNDSVKNQDIPPPLAQAGGIVTCSATVGNTSQLTATSYTLRRGVWLRVSPKMAANDMGGVGHTSGNTTIISAAGAPVSGRMFMRDDDRDIFVPIDDPSKLYVASDTASTIIVWWAI